MTVIVLTACPPGLRGYVTRWLLEVSAGVFVGSITARVRDLLWARVVETVSTGRAIMVYSAPNEQRLKFRVHGHHWRPVDVEGITLMLRPRTDQLDGATSLTGAESIQKAGWSKAAARRRAGR